MIELLQTIVKTTKVRISNPITGTFIFSWIAFNWKPIIFIIISKQDIENKIAYIEFHFLNINHLLIFPLISVVVYILIIPYLNLLFEYLLEFSRIKRNSISISKQKQVIKNKKDLTLEEIKSEKEITEFKERENNNRLNKVMLTPNSNKEMLLQIERKRRNNLNEKINDENILLK